MVALTAILVAGPLIAGLVAKLAFGFGVLTLVMKYGTIILWLIGGIFALLLLRRIF